MRAVDCPKCGAVVWPLVLEFVRGTDQVKPVLPDRYHVKCPMDGCGQNFYVRADNNERTDGQAVLREKHD